MLFPDITSEEKVERHLSMKTASWPLILLIAVLPWLWVSIGLYGFQSAAVTFAFYELGACLIPITLLMKTRPRFALQRRHIGLWLGLIVSMNLLMLTSWVILKEILFRWEDFVPQLNAYHFDGASQFFPFAILFMLFNPVIEEMFWRGLIFEQIRHKTNLFTGILISSVFFGAWHWIIIKDFFTPVWAIVITFSIMVTGCLFCVVYHKTRSLLPGALIHGLGGDLPILLIFYSALQTL